MTQRDIIINYLSALGTWQYEYKIRAIRTQDGSWIGARGDRDVRDLVARGVLERKLDGKYAMVRIAGSRNLRPDYVAGERKEKSKLFA
jgi:hypothetical protein